jgi:hypothetical protein
VLRRQRREREALPLFVASIAAGQPTIKAVMDERAERWARNEQGRREHLAHQWRRVRRRLSKYGDNLRPALLACWNTCGWPADPVYLLDMLQMSDTGRLDLELRRRFERRK